MFANAFVRFLLVGGVAAALNVFARILINLVTSYEVAIVLAYLVALTVAFALNRVYVFDAAEGRMTGQYLRFFIVNLVALAQVWIVSVGLARWLLPALALTWHAETIAHIIGVASPAITSYYGHKEFTFRAWGRRSTRH
ncbi:MAG: GtrA family protein [Xanthobacteraceae bacterium]